MADILTIYCFKCYNIFSDKYDVSLYKATVEAIKRFGCEIVEGSAEQVDHDQLDDLGRYKPKSNRLALKDNHE